MPEMPGGAGETLLPDVPDRVPPRALPGGRDPDPAPRPPLDPAELERYELVAPLTIDDMRELQRRVREIAGGLVEVYSHDGRAAIVDVRWPSGARVTRALPIR